MFNFWLHWVFFAVHRLSLVATSRGYSSLWHAGFSLWWLLLLWSTDSRHTGCSSCGLQALEHRVSSCGARVSCSAACGIFADQGSNPCPLHCRQILNHCTTREVPGVNYQLRKIYLSLTNQSLVLLWVEHLFLDQIKGVWPSTCGSNMTLSHPLNNNYRLG